MPAFSANAGRSVHSCSQAEGEGVEVRVVDGSGDWTSSHGPPVSNRLLMNHFPNSCLILIMLRPKFSNFSWPQHFPDLPFNHPPAFNLYVNEEKYTFWHRDLLIMWFLGAASSPLLFWPWACDLPNVCPSCLLPSLFLWLDLQVSKQMLPFLPLR